MSSCCWENDVYITGYCFAIEIAEAPSCAVMSTYEMPRRSEPEDRRREERRRTFFLAALAITSGHSGLWQEYICPMIAWVQSPHLSAME